MNTVPIVLTFDGNMSLAAGVCISSMMMSAKNDTFYDFFVLHSGAQPPITGLDRIKQTFPNMRLQYRSVGKSFSNAYEIRGITSAAYFRLLAPELIIEYDRAIYTDVDILYKMDLYEVYSKDLGGNYVAAVPAVGLMSETVGIEYLKSIGLNPDMYFVSGFLVMNLKALREDHITSEFKKLAKTNYKYQDQDILNIVCKDRISILPNYLSLGVGAIHQIMKQYGQYNKPYMDLTLEDALTRSNLHYNGAKPWKDWCPNLDQWWECYRNSPIYDPEFYFSFFYNKLTYLDQLPLLKRIKILLRYFIFGRVKN